MTKKDLFEMLKNVPEDAQIFYPSDFNDFLIGNRVSTISINGYYRNGDKYILSGMNIRPNYD